MEPTLVTSTQGWEETPLCAAATLWQTVVSGIGQAYCLYFVSESWQRWRHVSVVTLNVCRPQWISGRVMATANKSAHSPTWSFQILSTGTYQQQWNFLVIFVCEFSAAILPLHLLVRIFLLISSLLFILSSGKTVIFISWQWLSPPFIESETSLGVHKSLLQYTVYPLHHATSPAFNPLAPEFSLIF